MSRALTAKAPCARCPFRKDVPIYLRRERRIEIAENITAGRDFSCHETVRYVTGQEPDTSASLICAGAAKALMDAGGTTNLMRIAHRLGEVDLDVLTQRGAEVWNLVTWQKLAEGATGDNPEYDPEGEIEPCNTVNAGCLAPAGYGGLGGGVVVGTVAADGQCTLCGEAVCSNCADERGRCGCCTEED